jgi:hypothetical protein
VELTLQRIVVVLRVFLVGLVANFQDVMQRRTARASMGEKINVKKTVVMDITVIRVLYVDMTG